MKQCNFCKRVFVTRQALCKHRKLCSLSGKPIITKKKVKINTDPQNAELQQNIKDLEEKMEKMQSHNITQVNIDITNQQQNLNITKRLPDSFYQALLDKIGNNGLLSLLDVDDLNVVDIYKKIFPSNKIADNPVVYHDQDFKYLNDAGEIISGDDIIDIIARNIQTALLHASNSLISESLKTNCTNNLYDVYDIGKIQRGISDVNQMKQQLSSYIKLELIS